MQTVKQLLDSKGTNYLAISPDSSVYEAIEMMAGNQVGSLLVMSNDKLKGIITERDYSRKIILKGKSSKNTSVSEIMAKNVLCAKPEQTVEQCMALMTDKHVRHLPVVDNNEIIGIISIGDLVKSIISEQKFMIEQLEHYISGMST